MSEAMNARPRASRFYLLTTVSSIALISSALGADPALADSKEPIVWIEGGLQFDRVLNPNDSFALPIGNLMTPADVNAPLVDGLNLSRSQTENGKLTFQPGDSNWVFSAAVTYGRSRGKDKFSKLPQTPATSFVTFHSTIPTYRVPWHQTISKPAKVGGNSLIANTSSTESHFIIDFSAGKDVGLGMFGRDSKSVLSAGVRYANFTSKLHIAQFHGVKDAAFIEAHRTHPTVAFFPPPTGTLIVPWFYTSRSQVWREVDGSGHFSHDFAGLGPSISWEASVPFAGNRSHDGEFSVEWGVNGAVLFGKQKNKVEHRSSSSYNCYGRICHTLQVRYAPQSGETKSSKTVTVPNLGGFAGISYRVGDVKASFGYKADYFFRAIDTGIAGQHAVTRSFQGPYASISIGIGD